MQGLPCYRVTNVKVTCDAGWCSIPQLTGNFKPVHAGGSPGGSLSIMQEHLARSECLLCCMTEETCLTD